MILAKRESDLTLTFKHVEDVQSDLTRQEQEIVAKKVSLAQSHRQVSALLAEGAFASAQHRTQQSPTSVVVASPPAMSRSMTSAEFQAELRCRPSSLSRPYTEDANIQHGHRTDEISKARRLLQESKEQTRKSSISHVTMQTFLDTESDFMRNIRSR